MNLSVKIILPILLLLIIILGASGYLLYSLKQQEALISAQTLRIQKLNSLNERLTRQQEQTDYSVLSYRFNPDKAFLLAISQAELDKSKTLDEMFPFIQTSRGREFVNKYIDTRKEVESLRNELVKAIDEGNKEQIDLAYNRWSIQTQNIKAALADIGALNINSLEKTLASFETIRNEISHVIIILAFVVTAVIILLYFYLRFIITKPIIRLAQFTDEIAHKNFDTTTTTTTTTTIGVNSNDEIGMLSRAFNTMAVNLKESYTGLEEKVTEKTSALSQKVAELEDAKKAMLNAMEDLEKEKDKALHEKAKDEAILQSIGDGIVAIDLEGKIILMNEEAKRILALEGQSVLGQHYTQVWQIYHPSEKQMEQKDRPVELALQGKSVSISDCFYSPNHLPSHRVPVAINITPIMFNGQIIGVIDDVRDITEEKKLQMMKEQQLQHEVELETKERDFISMASHQLLTPLALVEGYLTMLLSDKRDQVDSEVISGLEESLAGTKRMDRLIKSLLTTSRIESGKLPVEKQPVDLRQLINAVTKEFAGMIEKKHLSLSIDLPESLMVLADPFHTREVISNLLDNAIKYTDNGSISILGKIENGSVAFSIADTGIGIPKDNIPHIFEKFFMSKNWITKQAESNGLGLYISKMLLELMNGRITVNSRVGKGTTFTFYLPVA